MSLKWADIPKHFAGGAVENQPFLTPTLTAPMNECQSNLPPFTRDQLAFWGRTQCPARRSQAHRTNPHPGMPPHDFVDRDSTNFPPSLPLVGWIQTPAENHFGPTLPVCRLRCPFSRCPIPDTVVFDSMGEAVDWFFTSKREGGIKRKLTRCASA